MRLPVNVTFHPDTETPLSLASRLARAMGYSSVADLLGTSTVQAVARGNRDAIRMLSLWSGVTVEHLRRFAVPTSEEAGEWRLGAAVFRKEMRVAGRFRFCPRCLIEDIEVGSGRPQSRPYERASWLTRAVTACTRHGVLLVEAGDGAPTSDVALFVAKGWHLGHQHVVPADEAELEVDAYVEGRIAGSRTKSFIDRQEVHVLLMLFQLLGWFVHNRLPSLLFDGTVASAMSARVVGFRLASEGWEAIERVVRDAIDLHRPAARTITEFFGPMTRHFRRNAAAPAYAEIIRLFQELVERNVPVGPGDRFAHPVERRQLHSVRSAAVEYALDPKRVRKLLEEHGVAVRSAHSDRCVYVSIEEADRILTDAAGNMTTVEVATALGTHDDRVREFIARGMLDASERGVKCERPFYRVARSAVGEFRSRLFERVPPMGRAHGLVTITTACQRRSLTQTDIIEMILDGRCSAVGRSDNSMTLGSLLVDLREIPISAGIKLACGDNKTLDGVDGVVPSLYLSLSEVERALSTTTVTVTALVKNGLLPIEVGTNLRTRRQQPFVHRNSIGKFLDTHRSLYAIARGWRRSITWMKVELDRKGLQPIFKTSGKIARYYRTDDLAKVSLLPPNV